MPSTATRTLTVGCSAGLSNRLMVLVSGLALATVSRRTFRMIWPRSGSCSATFAELFANSWNVEEGGVGEVNDLTQYTGSRYDVMPDLLEAGDAHLAVQAFGWLIQPKRFPGQARLQALCRDIFATIRPLPEIERAIATFRGGNFRSPMIGVHLRRGDLARHQPDIAANTREAIATTRDFLHQMPGAGILLCTDDGATTPVGVATRREGVGVRFRKEFGNRVVMTAPRSIDPRQPSAIQDALVDLWLLRSTDAVVGTAGSTFSVLASYGRGVPFVPCGRGTVGFRILDRAGRLAGISRLIAWRERRRARLNAPAAIRMGDPAAPTTYRAGTQAGIRKWLEKHAPTLDRVRKTWWSERNPSLARSPQNGVILYLVRSSPEDVRHLARSLTLLRTNYLVRFPSPVLLFVEPDFNDEWKAAIRLETGVDCRFEPVVFELPAFLDPEAVPASVRDPKFNLGYRHMCRFFAGKIYSHPALAEFDWYWRLDTDSLVMGPVHYDVFEFMNRRNLAYGYNCMVRESRPFVLGLWDLTKDYLRDHGIRPFFLGDFVKNGAWNRSMYYTNFEISRLDIWRSKAIRDYFEAIDRSGGIYLHRWGDGVIHALTVSIFVPRRRVHRFKDIPYRHQGFVNHSNPAMRLAQDVRRALETWRERLQGKIKRRI